MWSSQALDAPSDRLEREFIRLLVLWEWGVPV
jgi:hypothetical protein